ncbi:hypothetical protein IQ255_24100 [Pleurocapsales cyanobacterium LEGE 10410]|nr:hypothetical protein [Pleurocapsales cyanobacterium LEGE 10410]
MAWRGSTDVKDRFFGAAVYLFAIYDAMALGAGLLAQIPALLPLFELLQVLLIPISLIYGIFNTAIPFGFGSLVVFFILFLAVVRNERIAYFIRFNTFQSILFGIALSLIQIIFGTLGALVLIGGAVFIVATAACFYCIVQCIMGRYPEIPSISDIVYAQLPR